MVRWHHGLNGRESDQTLGDSEGQGSLTMGSQRVGHDVGTVKEPCWLRKMRVS